MEVDRLPNLEDSKHSKNLKDMHLFHASQGAPQTHEGLLPKTSAVVGKTSFADAGNRTPITVLTAKIVDQFQSRNGVRGCGARPLEGQEDPLRGRKPYDAAEYLPIWRALS